ncbi:hypothetical protein FO519_008280 [Halicephalobus sp. NKZ332]|nr:hypothetical protein FO519_008280 [Halicephalobus sp. NKZ332]
MVLVNKVCIITGASEGIGEAIAKTLAVDGKCCTVLASRQIDKLNLLVEKLHAAGCAKGNVIAIKCDITKKEDVQHVYEIAIEKYGKVDILVNCAGIMYYTMMKNLHVDEWEKEINVNCHGTLNMIGAVLPHFIEHKQGHIVNITSDVGKRGFAGLAVYSGTKFYLEGFSQSLRQEVAEYNVKITNIQPGEVATKLADKSTDQEARNKYEACQAGYKVLDPEDVARAVLFVLSQPAHVAVNEILIQPRAAPF